MSKIPTDPVAKTHYLAGATEEARLAVDGMTSGGKGIYGLVQQLAQMGNDSDEIARYVTVIYGPSLPWRERVSLAWQLVTKR